MCFYLMGRAWSSMGEHLPGSTWGPTLTSQHKARKLASGHWYKIDLLVWTVASPAISAFWDSDSQDWGDNWNTKQSSSRKEALPSISRGLETLQRHKQPRLMRVVDDTKMPVPNTTDSRQDIQGSLSTGSQAQEGHGFSAVHLASSELSQALIRHLCVRSVLSTPWYLSFTHSLLFLMVFNSLKFEIDIIWALVIPTIWEGDF